MNNLSKITESLLIPGEQSPYLKHRIPYFRIPSLTASCTALAREDASSVNRMEEI